MDSIVHDAYSRYIVACVFIAAVTFLPTRCLATIGGYTHTHTHRLIEGFMQYAVEMGSGAMMYDKDRFSLSKIDLRGGYRHTYSMVIA
jgi:hypothetical protein